MGGIGSGGKPRIYPSELVETIRRLYEDEGMTRTEVQAEIGRGVKVETVMKRHGILRRRPIRREQRESENPIWAGSAPSYTAAHTRVYSARGRASDRQCVDCGEVAKDWSYIGGCPSECRDSKNRTYSPDPRMYEPRCRPCHRQFDARRRKA